MNAAALQGVVHSDAEIMGGTPVFVGTRVPLQNLIDYLEGGESVEDFLDAFPTVKREQVIAVIEAGKIKNARNGLSDARIDRRMSQLENLSRVDRSLLRLSAKGGLERAKEWRFA